MSGLILRPGQGITICAHRGGGKTTLAQTLLAGGVRGGRAVRSFVIFDSKAAAHEWAAFDRALGVTVTSDWRAILAAPRVRLTLPTSVYRDAAGFQKPGRPGYTYTLALRAVMARLRHTAGRAPAAPPLTAIVWEEAMHSLSTRYVHPEARDVITQSRTFGGSPWVLTQQFRWVDVVALQEQEHLLCGHMAAPKDLDLVQQGRGIDASPLTTLGRFEWAYHLAGATEWQLYGATPLPTFGRSKIVNLRTSSLSTDPPGEIGEGDRVGLDTPETAAEGAG